VRSRENVPGSPGISAVGTYRPPFEVPILLLGLPCVPYKPLFRVWAAIPTKPGHGSDFCSACCRWFLARAWVAPT